MKIIDVNPSPGDYYNSHLIQKLFGIDTFKYEILFNSPIKVIVAMPYNYETGESITGKAIYRKEDLQELRYQFVTELAKNFEANGVDMTAQVGNYKQIY